VKLTPEQVIRASRVIVFKRHRFFMVPLFKLREVPDPSIDTLAVDGGMRLYYNPQAVVEFGTEFVPTFLAHEIQHVLRVHPKRMGDWITRHRSELIRLQPAIQMIWPQVGSPEEFFNLAQDAEINDDMDEAGWPWPEGFNPIRPATLIDPEPLRLIGYNGPLPDGKTAEFYAEIMLKVASKVAERMPQNPEPGRGKGPGGDGGGDEEGKGDGGAGSEGDEASEAEVGAHPDVPEGTDGDDAPDRDAGNDRDRTDGQAEPGNPKEDQGGGDDHGPDAGDDGAGGGDAGVDAQGGGGGDRNGRCGAPGKGRCGGCCGSRGENENFDDPNLPDPASANDLDLMRHRVALDIEEMAGSADGRGTGLGDYWLKWSQQMLRPPKVDWRQLLAKRVRGAITQARARVDWKYGPPSRRREVLRHIMGDEAPLLPVLRGPSPQVAFVVDVSGSMMGARIKQAFSEVLGISRACTHVPCAGVAVDAGLQGIVRQVRTADDLMKLNKGGGGTDMRVGIQVAADLKPAPEVIVIVTDGETPWPERKEMPKKAEVVVCVINRSRHYYDALPAHLKATAVLVGEDES
jgi:predicted metal-dependent peptidase